MRSFCWRKASSKIGTKSSLCAFDKGCHTFSGLLPCTYKGVIAKEADTSCSTNSAIALEDRLISCKNLIAALYVKLGSTAWSHRGL